MDDGEPRREFFAGTLDTLLFEKSSSKQIFKNSIKEHKEY